MKDVKDLMVKRLTKNQVTLLASIAQIADRKDMNVYIVGGFVRDLLLNIKNFDVDLVVEGDSVNFAEIIAKEFDGFFKSHARFGTSVVILQDQSRIDVAMARTESYPFPGALPKVEPSSLDKDLSRRDFTINSMAVKLNGEGAFSLIDYFNSENDLKAGSIRVLHSQSFIEDPCRIFRAIRFEQRFRFCIEDQTKNLMKSAIDNNLVDQLSGTRLMNEIKLILKETNPMSCMDRMREFSLLEFFAPNISNNDSHWFVIEKIDNALLLMETVSDQNQPEVWFVYFQGLFLVVKDLAFEKALDRLLLPLKIIKRMRIDREQFFKARHDLSQERELKPSEIYNIFSGLSPEAMVLLLAACSSELVNKYAVLYYNKLCMLAKTSLTGDDLIKMGIEPGPIFDNIFKALRDARVNGQLATRDEEIIFVESQFLKYD